MSTKQAREEPAAFDPMQVSSLGYLRSRTTDFPIEGEQEGMHVESYMEDAEAFTNLTLPP